MVVLTAWLQRQRNQRNEKSYFQFPAMEETFLEVKVENGIFTKLSIRFHQVLNFEHCNFDHNVLNIAGN